MDRLKQAENLYARRRDTAAAILAAERHRLAYRATGNQSHLVKAFETADARFDKDFCDEGLFFERLFLTIEMGYESRAKEALAAAKPRRGWWRAHMPRYYALYLAAEALTERGQAAGKHMAEIERLDMDEAWRQLILGCLEARLGEPAAAVQRLEAAYEAGCRSTHMFLALYDCFAGDGLKEYNGAMLAPLVYWAAARGFDLGGVAGKYRLQLFALAQADAGLAKRLYAGWPREWMLQTICRRLFAEDDVSAEALYYYKEAESKQLSFPGLNGFLIRAACRAGAEDVSRFALSRFLKEGPTDREALAFAYRLILTTDKFADLETERRPEMEAFALEGLKEGREDAARVCLYIWLLERAEAGLAEVGADALAGLEEIVWRRLFVYEMTVENPKVCCVWASEPHMRAGRVFGVTGGRAELVISGAARNISCFGEAMRGLIDEPRARITRVAQNAGAPLYERLFAKGYYCAELGAALASAYIDEPALNENRARLLERAAEDAALAAGLRNGARAALGAYYSDKETERAAMYYGQVDEATLSGAAVEHMLNQFIATGRHDRAVGLLLKKGEFVEDKALFAAVRRLAARAPGYGQELANAAYELLLKRRYDRQLLELTLEHYRGSQEDWIALSAQLTAMGAEDLRVDERIIENAIFIRRADGYAQAVFARMAAHVGAGGLTMDFAGYLAYEIIVNGLKPAFEAIEALEGLFEQTGDHFTAYALAHVYIGHGIENGKSEGIIKAAAGFCREDGLLFPIFKRIKTKMLSDPYIQRNAAFMHQSGAGGEVELLYRFDGEERFSRRKMKRARFGLWFAQLPLFYGETAEYAFRETSSGGDTQTPRATVTCSELPRLDEADRRDDYALVNAAALYEQMFRYNEAEELIGRKLAEAPPVIAALI